MGESNESSVAAMEMVEEGINQPKITPKRLKVEEIVEEEEDRISALPDGLLVEILSRLPSTRRAISTGTLSKRWKYLWASVSTIIFKHVCGNRPPSDFISLVDKTLTQRRQLKLRKFAVHTIYDIQFDTQFKNWIRYAISCDVEVLDLRLLHCDEFLLDKDFFINSCFTDLRLAGPILLNPTGAISWKRLRSLNINDRNLDEDLIENILSGSPLLETLVLNNCCGYRQLYITSKSVKKLVFSSVYLGRDADIEINAPNILSLTVKGVLELRKLLLLNLSSLVEAKLDYTKVAHKDAKEEEMLKGFIQSLCHVKEVKIGPFCSKVLHRLEAKGFIFPSNVKSPDDTYSDSDSVESSDWETNSDDDDSVEINDWDGDSDDD